MNAHHSYWENNIKKAVDAGKRLGVQPVLSPKDMTNPDVEHLGIMSYVANLQWVTPRPPLSDSIVVHLESTSGRVGEPVKVLYSRSQPNSILMYELCIKAIFFPL